MTLLLTRYEKRNDILRLIKFLERANRTDVKVRLMSQSTKGRSQKLLQYYRCSRDPIPPDECLLNASAEAHEQKQESVWRKC